MCTPFLRIWVKIHFTWIDLVDERKILTSSFIHLYVDLECDLDQVLKVILGDKYESYKKALNMLDLEPLFAQKCTKNDQAKKMFQLNENIHDMNMRREEKFTVQYAKTERLKKSAIPYMQKL